MIKDPEAVRWDQDEENESAVDDESIGSGYIGRPVVVRDAIISQPSHETTALLHRAARRASKTNGYASISDVEGQKPTVASKYSPVKIWHNWRSRVSQSAQSLRKTSKADVRQFCANGIKQSVGYLPAIMMGLLLNILDALSYGDYDSVQMVSAAEQRARHDSVPPW